jgi:hypothetical protein
MLMFLIALLIFTCSMFYILIIYKKYIYNINIHFLHALFSFQTCGGMVAINTKSNITITRNLNKFRQVMI